VPDQVPADGSYHLGSELRDLRQSFLHAVLAEVCDPARSCGLHLRRGDPFADRNQQDVLATTTAPSGGGRDPFAHAADVRGDV
jgi:hypothetical protein